MGHVTKVSPSQPSNAAATTTKPAPTGQSQWQAIALALLVPLTVAVLALVTAVTADARSRCHKGFQSVNGSQISTPLCQDLYLAQVAREYGSRYSAKAILYNPNVKKEVCLLVGQDIRVQNNCRTTVPRFRSR